MPWPIRSVRPSRMLILCFFCLLLPFSLLGQNNGDEKKREWIFVGGINQASLRNIANQESTAIGNGFHAGLQVLRGQNLFVSAGLHYFQYSTGEELLDRLPTGQREKEFAITGLKMPLFIGAHALRRDKVAARLHGGACFYFNTQQNNRYDSIGDLNFEEASFTIMYGGQLAWNFLVFDLTMENGLTQILQSPSDGLILRQVLNLSAGVKI